MDELVVEIRRDLNEATKNIAKACGEISETMKLVSECIKQNEELRSTVQNLKFEMTQMFENQRSAIISSKYATYSQTKSNEYLQAHANLLSRDKAELDKKIDALRTQVGALEQQLVEKRKIIIDLRNRVGKK